jgi:glutathione S-transferase
LTFIFNFRREGRMHTDFEILMVIFSHRAHLNDLENIVPFLGIGLLYSLSGPDLSTALLHFRLFVGARIYHTIAYLTPFPQPNRGLAFFVGFGVTFSMAYRLLKSRLYL